MWTGPGDRWSWGLGRNCVHLLLHREDHKVPGEFSESFPRCPMIPMLNYAFTVIHPLIIKNTNHLVKWSRSSWSIISNGSTLTQSISKVWFLTTFTVLAGKLCFGIASCLGGERVRKWLESNSDGHLGHSEKLSCSLLYQVWCLNTPYKCIKNWLDFGSHFVRPVCANKGPAHVFCKMGILASSFSILHVRWFCILLPLVAASSSLHFFNPLQQLWRWTEWTCQG